MSKNNARSNAKGRIRCGGFTAIELLVTLSVSAILLAIAVVNFSDRVQQAKSEGASDGFLRAAASARALAAQTGSRTALLVKTNTNSLSGTAVTGGCGDAAWAVVRWDTNTATGVAQPKAVTCLSQEDFTARYGTAVLNVESCKESSQLPGMCSVLYMPSGIGANTDTVILNFVAGANTGSVKTVQVQIQPGGKAGVKAS